MKTKRIPSAIPIYIAALVWILYGLALPLFEIAHILMAAGLSVVAYLAAGKFIPGRTVEVAPSSGDAEIDAQLEKCRQSLVKLREANAAIEDAAISARLARMEKAGAQILSAVAEKTERMDQVRRFMDYYLPTAAKLLEQYRALSALNARGEQIEKALRGVENSLEMIASAFEKQLDRLYRDEALDITSDISVLETMMAGDGLTSEGIEKVVKEEQEKCRTSN